MSKDKRIETIEEMDERIERVDKMVYRSVVAIILLCVFFYVYFFV